MFTSISADSNLFEIIPVHKIKLPSRKSILVLLNWRSLTILQPIFPCYMKKSVAVETKKNDRSTETESLLAHTPRKTLDPEIETSSSEAVTSEDVERQIRAVTDPLTQHLAHLCELSKELREAHTHRRHEETASSRVTSSFTGKTGRSDSRCYSVRVIHWIRGIIFWYMWWPDWLKTSLKRFNGLLEVKVWDLWGVISVLIVPFDVGQVLG